MKVYQIVELTSQTAGHGDSADVAILSSIDAYSVTPYPVFLNEAEARKLIEDEDIWNASVLELELI